VYYIVLNKKKQGLFPDYQFCLSKGRSSIFTEINLFETFYQFIHCYWWWFIIVDRMAGVTTYLSHLRSMGAIALVRINH
jgi:hypothetical protein